MSLTLRARTRTLWLQFAVVAVVMAGLTGLAALTEPLFAEGGDSYPGIDAAPGSLWRLTDKSPDDSLMWYYGDNATKTGQFEHLVKNEISSNVRITKIKAYFTEKPTSVQVNVFRRGVCHFSSTDSSSRLRMFIGGQLVYDQAAYGERKYGNDARDLEKRVIRQGGGPNDGTTDTWNDNPKWETSRVCGDLPADTYEYKVRDYRCTERDKDDKCTKREYVLIQDDIQSRLGDATGAGFVGGKGPAINPYSVKADGSRLWEVEIVVQLTGARWTSADEGTKLNQIRYDLRVPGAKYVGFAETPNDESGERQFGVAADINDTTDKWGTKIAVPFGMSCADPGNIDTNLDGKPDARRADIKIYDVDMQSFGRVYALVYEKNQETGAIRRLNKNTEYYDLDRMQPAGSWDRLVSANAYNRETSRFSMTMKSGFSYMLIINNPNQVGENVDGRVIGLSPLGNVVSIRVPTDSLPGVTNCNYTLTPSVDPIVSSFSYDASFSVTGRISVTGEDFQAHDWRLCELRFPSRATIDPAINTNNPLVQQPGCQTIDAGSQPEGFGANFATGTFTRTVNNVPLGQTVCFMMSVRKPTFKADDNVWSHSQLQCSQSVATPKVQIHGDDLKATGQVSTSVGRIGTQMYGSWGEYAVLSNGANIGMGSGNGLNGGIPAATGQEFWKPLTFASGASQFGGIYGNFGGVTVPVPFVNRDGEVGGPASIGGLAGLERKKIYRIPGTLRITGNLDYGVFGPFNDIADIPRIVLVADDIVIDPGVTNIDPWLVAIGAGGQPGKISTCSTVPGWSMSGAALYGAQNGAGGICTQQLRFNGPVLANKVYLYRTFDNRNGDPAEIFNLRADAYLSALSGGGTTKPVATTDFTTELPPRF